MEYQKILDELNDIECLLAYEKSLLGKRVEKLEKKRDKLIWKLNDIAPTIAMRKMNAELLPGFDNDN